MRCRERNRAKRRADGGVIERRPGSLKPFHRIVALVRACNAAMAEKDMPAIVLTQAAISEYQSRGHGRKPKTMQRSCLSRAFEDRSKYSPAECFARGCA